MKRPVMICLLLVSSLMMFGCATMPPPRPGTVKIVNETEGAYGYCFLFRGDWSRDDLFALDSKTGGLMWAKRPLLKFQMKSALGRDFHRVQRIDLIPNTSYTLYIFWARFDGRELGESVVSFRTYINPRRRCHVDQLGRRICASEFVYLPHIDTSVTGPLRFHKTLRVGDWVKALFGMP